MGDNSRTAVAMNANTLDDLSLRLEVLTGMNVWTNTQVANRAFSLLKDDLADRLKEAGKWEEYQERAEDLDSKTTKGGSLD